MSIQAETDRRTHAEARPAGTRVPPQGLLDLIASSPSDYAANGRHFFEIFKKHAGLKPSDRVLDVGCGCGRMAWPLTEYLTDGTYDGFDVVPELVSWCRQNIGARHGNFRFLHADVSNTEYRRFAATAARRFRFPYADAAFDFTFLTSVFTHMLPGGVANYVAEIARTLAPGGTALMTFFILDGESRCLQKTPAARLRFRYPYWSRGVMLKSLLRPEAAVSYPEETVRDLLGRGGLEVQQILPGFWSSRAPAVSFQDIVLAKRKGEDRRSALQGMNTTSPHHER